MPSILATAHALADRVETRASELGVAVSLCVVDAGGNLVLHVRMDGTVLAAVDIAERKAYTAVALGRPTMEIAEDVLPGGPMFGFASIDGGRYAVFGGGIPFRIDGVIAGAIGVSGALTAQDIAIGEGALEDVGLR
ncbi:MAG: heme-binding protein [Candidatus Limnocylindrales bacterium]